MKKKEIRQGAFYVAKINNKLTTVRVDAIRKRLCFSKPYTRYDVTNMTTGRKTNFYSAQKFRRETSNPALNKPIPAKPAPHTVKGKPKKSH